MTATLAIVPLRRIATIVNGGTPTADADNWSGDVLWATPVDLAKVDGGRLSETERTLTVKGLRSGSASVPAGSLLLSTRAPIGYVASVDVDMAFNQGCKGIVPRQDLVDAEYLQYWLWAHRERLQSLGTGSTFMELGNDALLGFGVALPPVSQQRAIAAFVRQQFALIDTVVLARQRQLTLIADRRVARLEAMLRMVTAKGAEPVPLRRLLRPRQEQDRTDLAVLSIYRDHGVVPKASRSDNFNATPEDLTRYQRVAVNDLVVNKMKAWSGSVAVSPEEGIVSPDYLVCRIEDRVEPRFLHHVLRSPKLVTEMRIRSRGIRPNQERLYWDDLADIRIPLPTRADQARMAAEVDEALGEYESEREPLVKSVQLLVESKRSLILAAVGGRVTVPDTSDVES